MACASGAVASGGQCPTPAPPTATVTLSTPTPTRAGGERVLLARNATWRYATTFDAQGRADARAPTDGGGWTTAAFDDGAWSTAAAPFAFGPLRNGLLAATTLTGGAGNGYFRLRLTLAASDYKDVQLGGKAFLTLRVAADNNATVWLDGTRVSAAARKKASETDACRVE